MKWRLDYGAGGLVFLALFALRFFLALPLVHLFFGHLVIVARGEHRARAGSAAEALLAAAANLAFGEAADAADRFRDGA